MRLLKNSEEMHPGTGRIQERSEKIENRSPPLRRQLLPDRSDGLESRMKPRRENKSHPDLLHRPSNTIRTHIHPQAERLKHIRTTTLFRHPPVAMFDNGNTERGKDEKDARRNIDKVHPAAARATRINNGTPIPFMSELKRFCMYQERLSKGSQFLRSLSAIRQRNQKIGPIIIGC